jgi:hypothetical protein
MTLKEWLSSDRNKMRLLIPSFFILGLIFLQLGFFIGTIYGILAYHFKDYGMDENEKRKKR